jgi:hypothetical protein
MVWRFTPAYKSCNWRFGLEPEEWQAGVTRERELRTAIYTKRSGSLSLLRPASSFQ